MQKVIYTILTLSALAAFIWGLYMGGERLNQSLGAEELCYPYMSSEPTAAIYRGKRFSDVPGLEPGVGLKEAIRVCEEVYGFQTRR